MMLGTAGFTSLMCAFAIQAREELLLGEKVKDVLVTGATGGVGGMAVMALSKFGYNVTAVTGKKDKINYLKELGAQNTIDRKDFEGEPRVLGKGLWDGVVDTVGGSILANAISQTKHSGIVAACGNAANIKLNTTVMPFIIRGVKLWGIDSVMISKKRREFIWSQVSKLIDFKILDIRGVTVRGHSGGERVDNVAFDHPDPTSAIVTGQQVELNARAQQITSQKSFGVEVTKEGAAPAFITVTMESNNTA